jgi:hypothetical protein
MEKDKHVALTELSEEMGSSTVVVGDFNAPLL